jgi:hypothetical protein
MNTDRFCSKLVALDRDQRTVDPVRAALRAVDGDGANFPQAFASALAVYQHAQADRDAYVWFWVRACKPGRGML